MGLVLQRNLAWCYIFYPLLQPYDLYKATVCINHVHRHNLDKGQYHCGYSMDYLLDTIPMQIRSLRYLSYFELMISSTFLTHIYILNSHNHAEAHMRQRPGMWFVHLVIYHLFSTKSLTKLMLIYCQLDPWQTKNRSKYILFIQHEDFCCQKQVSQAGISNYIPQ